MGKLKEACKISWKQIRPKYKNTWKSKGKMWILSKASLFSKYPRKSSIKYKHMIVINKSVKKKKIHSNHTRQQLSFQIFLRLKSIEAPMGRPGFSVTLLTHLGYINYSQTTDGRDQCHLESPPCQFPHLTCAACSIPKGRNKSFMNQVNLLLLCKPTRIFTLYWCRSSFSLCVAFIG